MPEELKQNPQIKSEGVDLERLRQNAADLKIAQTQMEPKAKDQGMLGAAFMLSTAVEFAIILAAPLIGAVFLGRWLTAKYHNPAYSIIALLVALALSSAAIALDIRKLSKKIKNK